MYISTLHLDELLQELDPEEDSVLYGFAQTLKDLVSGVTDGVDEIESRLHEIEERLKHLEEM